jgi:hypothetical protein
MNAGFVRSIRKWSGPKEIITTVHLRRAPMMSARVQVGL